MFSRNLLKVISYNFISLKSIFLFEKLIVIREFVNFADYYEPNVSLPATQQSVSIYYNDLNLIKSNIAFLHDLFRYYTSPVFKRVRKIARSFY